MKTLLKARILKLVKDERGIAMPMALIILVIGGMLIIPFVYFSELNLKTDVITREFNERVYAADAGVQLALWNFKYNPGYEKPTSSASLDFEDAVFSGKNIDVNVTVLNKGVNGYEITSIASDSSGSNTIVAYIADTAPLNFSAIMDNAITSLGDVTIKPGTDIIGDIQYNGDIDIGNHVDIDGDTSTDPISWPTAAQLIAFYSAQVVGMTPVPANTTINISSGTDVNPYLLGPLYAAGNLTIDGSNGSVAKLQGIVYIKGNLVVMPNCKINLNGQTIFVEGSITFQPGSIVAGTGCIIAIGDILFQPNMAPGNRLVGAESDLTPSNYETANKFILGRFQAIQSGDMVTFRVRCQTGNIKLAIYTDNSGSPGTLVNAMNDPIEITTAGWNDIAFPSTLIVAGTWYWLAGNSSATVIGRKSTTGISYLYKAETFSTFSFPSTFNPTGFAPISNYKLLFAGHESSYVLVLSVSGQSTIKPNGSFYGTVAGNTEVEIFPNSTLQWVEPGDGLNFPLGDKEGGGETTSAFDLVRYIIQ